MAYPDKFMQTIFKYILSFFKRDWILSDYPVNYVHHDLPEDIPQSTKLRPIRWHVGIPNWLRMTGYGDTKDEAYADLEEKFYEFKRQGNQLPRPGTKVPIKIEFAPRVQVNSYDEIARDFFDKISGMNYQNVLITDASSLWDFPFGENEDELVDKIREVYNIDISNIEDGNLVRIFEMIDQHRPT
jgi:hypothetical protein